MAFSFNAWNNYEMREESDTDV